MLAFSLLAPLLTWEALLLLICLVLLLMMVLLCTVVYLTPQPLPKILSLKGEDTFHDVQKDSRVPFPSLVSDSATVSLSVVIPAYNEEERLPIMLQETVDFLEARTKRHKGFCYELLIVDDGSSDRTTQVGLEWSRRLGSDKCRVLTLYKNRGKGGAVRMGMLRARGERLLFADADGASKFEDLVKLEAKLDEIETGDGGAHGLGLACGSRAHLEDESIAQRSYIRTFLMHGFHTCVYVFGVKTVRDTQCGFKLLTRRTARVCFSSLHIERWAFDVELLKIAEMLQIPLAEVAVRWQEIDGSKLNPLLATVQMFKDLFLLWLRYRLGLWALVKENE